jgi:hypothetical protein
MIVKCDLPAVNPRRKHGSGSFSADPVDPWGQVAVAHVHRKYSDQPIIGAASSIKSCTASPPRQLSRRR